MTAGGAARARGGSPWTSASEKPPPRSITETRTAGRGAPDLRGLWQVTEIEVDGVSDPNHRVLGHIQRIEQCGDRLVRGVVEDGVHVLRPVGLGLEVTRRRDGEEMVWQYLGVTARLARLGPPERGLPR
jgi:hypothetical protein